MIQGKKEITKRGSTLCNSLNDFNKEVFVVACYSVIKGIGLNTIEGVCSTQDKASDKVSLLICSILNKYGDDLSLQVSRYNGGEDNDCPCAYIKDKNNDFILECLINIETYKMSIDI